MKSLLSTLLCMVIIYTSTAAHAQSSHKQFNYSLAFSLEYPDDWEALRDHINTRAFIRSPKLGWMDHFQENLNIVVDNIADDTDLDEVFSVNVSQMQKHMHQFKLGDASDTQVSSFPAKRLTYQHTINYRKLSVVAYFLVTDGRAFVLTGTALPSTYSEYEPIFDAMVSSFTLE